jgi:hypothetical protein
MIAGGENLQWIRPKSARGRAFRQRKNGRGTQEAEIQAALRQHFDLLARRSMQ